MNILAIESSSACLSVALLHNKCMIVRESVQVASHSGRILPLVYELFAEAGLSLKSLNGIAFGAGPGAFTGLRLACAIAQGLAFAHDLPVLGIGSLEALAFETGSEKVYACVDARMGEIYLAAYQRVDTPFELETVLSPIVIAPHLAPQPPGQDWIGCGNGFAAYAAVLENQLTGCLNSTQPQAIPHARALALLAAPRFARGEGEDAILAAPQYIRHKVALTTAERLAT